MPEINKDWGACITALMAKHGLTTRGAMLKAGGRPSHTTIKDWKDGILPKYTDLAYQFLSHFELEEAVECLRAAGLPVPSDWQCSDPIETLGIRLRETRPELSDATIQEILDFARERIQEDENRESDFHE